MKEPKRKRKPRKRTGGGVPDNTSVSIPDPFFAPRRFGGGYDEPDPDDSNDWRNLVNCDD